MTTEYHASVWRKALHDAEFDVIRATATPIGGRLLGEDLMAYVDRTKQIQGAAIAHWMTAAAELDAATSSSLT